MNQKKKRPFVVNLAMVSVVTLLIWIGFDVYRALTVKPPATVSEAALAPLNPALDSTTLNELQKRVYVDENEIDEPAAVATPIPTIQATATPLILPTESPLSTISP